MAQIKFKTKSQKGITLVEIIVAVFIIVIFSVMLISNFPKIQDEFAISRAAYQLAQDLRKTQDLGLSGVPLSDASGNLIVDINGAPMPVRGYGIYILSNSQQYIIYADVADNNGN